MALTLDGTNGIVSSGSITTQSATGVIFSDSSSLPAASSPNVLKNRIINGDMRIDQRNAGASVTPTATTYTLDRWSLEISDASKLSVQQNAGAVTPPVGFTNYLGVTTVSAFSIVAASQFQLRQFIEGFNIADLGWGTANAKTVTLSFWVRSSLTGTFGGAFRNEANNRSYPFSYTISAANTWEQKSITVAGDTTGTWLTNNDRGIAVLFGLGVGSDKSGTAGAWAAGNFISVTGAVSVVGTGSATFYITGVQLEQNTSATPFERRLYNQELANCQRYYQTCGQAATGRTYGAGSIELAVPFKVTMRSAPTATLGGFSGSQAVASQYGVGNVTMSSILGYSATVSGSYFNPAISGGTTGAIVGIINGDAFGMSAEL
jgi:hypothetical protein